MGMILGAIGLVSQLAGGIAGAQAQKANAEATATADRYQAQIANNNALLAKQNAEWSSQFGEISATASSMKTRSEIGSMKANQAAGGIDVNSGSAVSTRLAAEDLGEVNALTIQSNASRQAYGYTVQEQNANIQSQLDKQAASDAIRAGGIAAAGTLLSTAGSIAGPATNYFDTYWS